MNLAYRFGLCLVLAMVLAMGISSLIPSAVAYQEGEAGGLVTRVVALEQSLPIGTIFMNASKTPPPGWVLCDGREVSKANFPELFNAIKTTYGGNGNPNFRLPNLSNRMPIGAGSSHPLASQGGNETVKLTAAQLPPHTHSGTTDRGATLAYRIVHAAGGSTLPNHTVGFQGGAAFEDKTDQNYLGAHHVHSFTTNGGDGCQAAPVSVLPPYTAINFIIKTK